MSVLLVQGIIIIIIIIDIHLFKEIGEIMKALCVFVLHFIILSFLISPPSLSLSVPPYISRPPSSSTVLVNASATFRCCSEGIPLPSIHWLKNGTIIDEANRISFTIQESANENCSVLNIANPVFSDRGEYACISTNRLAEELMATSDPVELIVQCKLGFTAIQVCYCI